MTEQSELEAVLEAILFVTPEPVPRDKLLEVFESVERERIEAALDSVLARYRLPADASNGDWPRGMVVDEVAGGVRLVTRPEFNAYLRKFFEVTGRTKLSLAALETLAIVAYRQPITGPEIQELRGKSSVAVLKTLLEKRLIRISGRKDVVGKPFFYATTRDFLLHFGLQSLKDLPPLEEFEETFLSDGDFAATAGESLRSEDREEEIERQTALVLEREGQDEPGEQDEQEPPRDG